MLVTLKHLFFIPETRVYLENLHSLLSIKCLKSMPHVRIKYAMKVPLSFMLTKYGMEKQPIGLKMV